MGYIVLVEIGYGERSMLRSHEWREYCRSHHMPWASYLAMVAYSCLRMKVNGSTY